MSDGEPYELSSGDESELLKDSVATETWRASEPPEEVFTEAENCREWTFDVIGEEVDENENVMFEVRWDDWARHNGTKTTWSTSATLSDNWKKQQRRIRGNAARESLELALVSSTDIHNMETYLAHQAYGEKLKRSASMPQRSLLLQLAKNQAKHAEQVGSSTGPESQGSSSLFYSKRNNRRATTRQASEISLANSSARGSSTSSRSSTSKPQSHVSSMLSASTSLTSLNSNPPRSSTVDSSCSTDYRKGKRPFRDSDSSPSSRLKVTEWKDESLCSPKKRARMTPVFNSESSISLSSSSQNHQTLKNCQSSANTRPPAAQRSRLGKEWTKIAAQDKAAPIYIVNTVDGEPVPNLDPGFCYLESQYQFSSNVPRPADMEDFLVKCSSRYCTDLSGCECQTASAFVDRRGTPMLAYTPDGYFAFDVPKGIEVVECNKLCACSLVTCQNRVSQRPRDIPIEIFKTESRGWGVRSLVDVRRGKVLGLYTGLVIPRETAHSHPDYVNSDYLFDLDGDESGEDHALHHAVFSVDSQLCGNWTRFINHSCAPNLQVYLVVHDIPPANGLPFIAFVALEHIPAKTEFTFDYDPRAAERIMALKGKKKAVPKGAKVCSCGAEACRGILSC